MRVIVMAVPWRADRLRKVRDIREQVPHAEIVWSEPPPVGSATHTWMRALETAGDDAAVFLEDDVQLTSDWERKVEEVIAEHSDSVIQFFSMRKADLTTGSRWEPGRTFLMNQCFYLPAGDAAALLDFARDNHPENTSGNDLTTRAWLQSSGRHYWLHVPSLVQHLEMKSEIGPRSSKRQSMTFEP